MTLILSGTDGLSDVDGSASTPAIRGTDTNTGIFFPAADTIAFAEGGTEVMRIDSDGDVGIGTTSPSFSVDVVRSGGDAQLRLMSQATGTNGIVFRNNAAPTSAKGAILYPNGSAVSGADTMQFVVDASERMRIDSSGNVGIGTTSPGAKQEIYVTRTSSTNAVALILNDNVTGAQTNGVYKAIRSLSNGGASVSEIRFLETDGTNNNTGIAFATSPSAGNLTERARITSDGTLFVGTTSGSNPGVGLFSNGTVNATTAASASNCVQFWNQATTGDNLFATFYTEGGGGSLRGSIDYNRGAGLTRYNTTSDATLKNIIGDSDGAKSVEILNSTRIREFAWKNDETQKSQIGVIAQELYETYKGAVSVGGDYEVTIPAVTEQRLVSEAVLDEDGNEIEAAVYETVEVEPERTETKYRPWAVDKTAFTFHLVAGWQAHEKTIKEQQARIEALEAQNAAFEARLAALEAK